MAYIAAMGAAGLLREEPRVVDRRNETELLELARVDLCGRTCVSQPFRSSSERAVCRVSTGSGFESGASDSFTTRCESVSGWAASLSLPPSPPQATAQVASATEIARRNDRMRRSCRCLRSFQGLVGLLAPTDPETAARSRCDRCRRGAEAPVRDRVRPRRRSHSPGGCKLRTMPSAPRSARRRAEPRGQPPRRELRSRTGAPDGLAFLETGLPCDQAGRNGAAVDRRAVASDRACNPVSRR